MKLQLEINPTAIKDPSRALEPYGVLITPPLDESFWLYRVAVSDKQAIIGFPKFSVIGVGFQKEEADWNTNLPSGVEAKEIYDHIKKNKGDKDIPRDRCIEAIRLIQKAVLETQRAETIGALKGATNDANRLALLGQFLRRTNNWQVAEAFGH